MKDLLQYINNINVISQESAIALGGLFEQKRLKKGDFFAREGEYAQKIGFLQSGILRAFFINKKGKEYNKQFFVAPTIIGAYTSLITKQPNRIAQQALTNCVILVADYQSIEKLYHQYHDLERLGRKVAEYYFLEKEQKEIEMALLDADKRYEILKTTFPTLENEIPQYHIASYLGISATQLSRIRRQLLKK